MADQIDKNTLEVAQADDEVYSDMEALANELPDHSPRYILLSYPLTLVRLAGLEAGKWNVDAALRHQADSPFPMYSSITYRSLVMQNRGCCMQERKS